MQSNKTRGYPMFETKEEEDLIVKMPNRLIEASYSGTTNSVKLLSFIFAKIDYFMYPAQADKNITITSKEWCSLLGLKSHGNSLKNAAQDLDGTLFKFKHGDADGCKIFESLSYEDGLLEVRLGTSFLLELFRDDKGRLNPIVGLMLSEPETA